MQYPDAPVCPARRNYLFSRMQLYGMVYAYICVFIVKTLRLTGNSNNITITENKRDRIYFIQTAGHYSFITNTL